MSTPQIFPASLEAAADSDQPLFVPAGVEFWCGASLATVGKTHIKHERVSGGVRDRITVFSRASRLRLMRTCARVKRDALPLFVTLTYPDFFPSDPLVWKNHLKAWWQRLHRRYPHAGFVWRLEVVERKSGVNIGEIAPHFHIILYGIPEHPGFKEWVSLSWFQVVDSGDVRHLAAGTRVELLRNWRHILAYASKVLGVEVSKSTQVSKFGVGRWWGVYGRQFVPWGVRVAVLLSEKDAQQVLRWFRRFARLRLRANKKSLTCFLDADRWFLAVIGSFL